jgi:hypothetical protein
MPSVSGMILNVVRTIEARAHAIWREEFAGALRGDGSLAGRDPTSVLRSRYFHDPSSVLGWLCCQGPSRTQSTPRGY